MFRALKLGDMLCAVPALRALRSAFPSADIELIGLAWARAFAARFPRYIDRFRVFPGFPGLPERASAPAQVAQFLRAMQARRYDIAIQMHGDGRVSNSVVALFGARAMAGFAPADVASVIEGRFLPYPGHGTEAERLLALARFLGAGETGIEPEFPVYAEDEAGLRRVLGADWTRTNYACVHAGTASGQAWDAAAFAAVGDDLAQRGVRVVLTGTAEERERTRAVASRMHHDCLDLAGETDLGALAALLSRARLLVANDTGVAHLGYALRTATVVIFTGADMERWAPHDRRLHRVVSAQDGIGAALSRARAAVHELLDRERADAA